MSERGLLIVLSGPSGVGKGTVRRAILESEDNDFQHSIPMTTRKMREGEIGGIDYFFRSREEFESMIEAGEILEYVEYVGNYYETPSSYVSKILDEEKDAFLEIEVQGAKQVKGGVPDSVFIFLIPSGLAELKSRVVGRETDADGVIEGRIKVAKEEIEMMALYDCAIVNDGVPLAVERIKHIAVGEYFRVDCVVGKYIKTLKGI